MKKILLSIAIIVATCGFIHDRQLAKTPVYSSPALPPVSSESFQATYKQNGKEMLNLRESW